MTHRSVTPEEIAQIIEETVAETEKDLQHISAWLQKIARISLYISASLKDKEIAIETTATRDLKEGMIATRCLQRLLAKAPTKKIE